MAYQARRGRQQEILQRPGLTPSRRKHTQRRGSGAGHLDADEIEIASPAPDDQLLALNEALEPRQAELVKLRYFVGLKIEEAAEVLGISEATAKRWWAYARAWLFNEIGAPPKG